MSNHLNLKPYARALLALTVIAAPLAETIAQTTKVPAEVIARRLANKNQRQQNHSQKTKKAKAASVQLYGYVTESQDRDPGLYKFSSTDASNISLVNSDVQCYNAATYYQGTFLSSYYIEDND